MGGSLKHAVHIQTDLAAGAVIGSGEVVPDTGLGHGHGAGGHLKAIDRGHLKAEDIVAVEAVLFEFIAFEVAAAGVFLEDNVLQAGIRGHGGDEIVQFDPGFGGHVGGLEGGVIRDLDIAIGAVEVKSLSADAVGEGDIVEDGVMLALAVLAGVFTVPIGHNAGRRRRAAVDAAGDGRERQGQDGKENEAGSGH